MSEIQDDPQDQIRALRHGNATNMANLSYQTQRCNELAGAIEELTRRNLVKVGMLETVLKAVLLHCDGAPEMTFTIPTSSFKDVAGRKLSIEHRDGETVITLS